jgi:coenzyme Q-binding protein COQ10
MGTRLLRKQFSTIALLERPRRIDISSHDPLFDRFEQNWRFQSAAMGGTNVEYHVDFRFRSLLLQRLIGATFADRCAAMIEAYRQRARRLYGVH